MSMQADLSRRLVAAASFWCDWMAPLSMHVAALVGALALCGWLLRGRSARLRYALWLLVPLRLVLPPTLALATGWSWWLLPPSAAPAPAVGERTEVPAPAPVRPKPLFMVAARPTEIAPPLAANPTSQNGELAVSTVERKGTAAAAPVLRTGGASDWRRGLFLVWGAIASLLLARLGLGILAARRLVAAAMPAPDGALSADVERLQRELGIRRPIAVRLLPGSGVPMVIGVLRPCLVLPEAIETGLDHDELQAVLVHELHHVARHDALVNLMQAVLGAVYFFHPAVWWANSRLSRLREDACDEATVATLRGERVAYGSGMVKIAEMLVGPPPRVALGVAESGRQVTRRLKRILDPRLPFGLHLRWPARLFLLGAAAVLLPAAARPAGSTVEGVAAPATPSPQRGADAKDLLSLSAAVPRNRDLAAMALAEAGGNQTGGGRNAAKERGKTIRVSGRVIGPDGKPVAGAEITVWWHFGSSGALYKDWRPPVVQSFKPRFGATSGADGRFDFTFSQSEIDENAYSFWNPGYHFGLQVVAAAPGYGPAWAFLEGPAHLERTLKLVPDDVPVQIRVRNLEGLPVAGASMRVERVSIGDDEQNSLWQTSWAGLAASQRSDAAGRLPLRGIGRGRTVVLHIDGPTIEQKVVFARIPPIDQHENGKPVQIDIVAGPSKPIEGTIRAKDTGKPLAGVMIWGEEERYHRHVQAVTDEQGRYRLEGLPKTRAYTLTVNPPRDLAYLPTKAHVADTAGLQPIAVNFTLRRGVPVRCRFVDKVTRQRVRPGDLHYTPLKPNAYYAEVDEGGVIPSREYFPYYVPDSDGVYHFVAWPGVGVLGAMPQNVLETYLPTPTDPSAERKARGDLQLTYFRQLLCGWRVIEPREGEALVDIEVVLDPGRTLRGALIGPDSKPVRGVTAYGLNYNAQNSRNVAYGPEWDRSKLSADAFAVHRLQPHVDRTISFIDSAGKLVGHLVIDGEKPGPLTVRMQAWGVVTGRIVDAQGRPCQDVQVRVRYPSLPAPGFLPLAKEFKVDADGRFRIDGLIPGLEPEMTLTVKPGTKPVSLVGLPKKLVVKPGELLDLGEIKVQLSPANRNKSLNPASRHGKSDGEPVVRNY